jgi:hypothetical protein
LLFNFALEYAIRKAQGNRISLELNGTKRLLVYAGDTNLLDDSINTMKENTETLLGASSDVGLEISAEKTQYMIIHSKSGQNQNMIANESFENVEKFKCLGTTQINQNDFYDEVMIILNLGSAYCHSVQNLVFPSRMRDIKIKI